ncbi:MAG TPA: hypothetical protein VFO18_18035 [Methylomirabilota bacterium]|nr:hypothetical protein [Methylomirabilota bacterium]
MSAEPLLVALVSSVAWVLAAVTAHFALFHTVQVERRARTIVCLWGAAALGHLWTCLLAGADAWRAAYGLIVISCAFILYLPFYYTIAASQSVQMLIRLDAAGDGLPVEEVRRLWGAEKILLGRLETMIASGYLEPADGRYAITARGVVVARPFQAVKTLWRLGPGG